MPFKTTEFECGKYIANQFHECVASSRLAFLILVSGSVLGYVFEMIHRK